VDRSEAAHRVRLQYDDDRNELPLDGFAVLDLSVARAIDRRLQIFLAVENAFDVEYDVGRTPVRTVGWPRTMRGGLRIFLP
jgi:outer membrane receptor protein involved in Fe transport